MQISANTLRDGCGVVWVGQSTLLYIIEISFAYLQAIRLLASLLNAMSRRFSPFVPS